MSDVEVERALEFVEKDQLFLRPNGPGRLKTLIHILFNKDFKHMLLLKVAGTCPVQGFPQVVCMQAGDKNKRIIINTADSAEMRNKLVKNRVTLKWMVVPKEFEKKCLENKDVDKDMKKRKELLAIWEKLDKMKKGKVAHQGFDLVFSENKDVRGSGDAGSERKDKVRVEEKSGEKIAETAVVDIEDPTVKAETSLDVNLVNNSVVEANACAKPAKESNSPEKCKTSMETSGPNSLQINSCDASAPESTPASELTGIDVSSGNGVEPFTTPSEEAPKESTDATKITEQVAAFENQLREAPEEQCEVKKMEMAASMEDEALEYVNKKITAVRQMMAELFGSSTDSAKESPKLVDLLEPEASAGSADNKAVKKEEEVTGQLDDDVSGDMAELPSESGDLCLTKTEVVPDHVLSEWAAAVEREHPINEDLISACSETTVEADGNVYSVEKAYSTLDDPMEFLEKLPLTDPTASIRKLSSKSSGQKIDSRGNSSVALKDQKDRQIKALRENVQFKDRLIEDLKSKLKILTAKSEDKDASTIAEIGADLSQMEDASLSKSEEFSCTELTSSQIRMTLPHENATFLPKCEIIKASAECTFRGQRGTLISPLFVDGIREKTVHPLVCLRLRHSDNHMYSLQVCFPKIRDGVDLHIGSCFLQIKLLAFDSFPVACYHFIFDARNGTCFRTDSAHTDKVGCDSSTYTSPACINLQSVKAETGASLNDFGGVLINTEVRIMLMCTRSCFEEEVHRGNSFENKVLTDLALWSQGCGYPVMRKVTFICGPNLGFQKTIGEYVLRGTSPIFEALLEQNMINGKGDNVFIFLSYVCPRTMMAVCDYLHGRATAVDWNDVDLILNVLLFSSFFLMADLALTCAEALLSLRDEELELEKVIAIIEAGRKFGFLCLVNRGTLWLEKKRVKRCQQGLLAIEPAIPSMLLDSTESVERSSPKLQAENSDEPIRAIPVESQCSLYNSKWDNPLRRTTPPKKQ